MPSRPSPPPVHWAPSSPAACRGTSCLVRCSAARPALCSSALRGCWRWSDAGDSGWGWGVRRRGRRSAHAPHPVVLSCPGLSQPTSPSYTCRMRKRTRTTGLPSHPCARTRTNRPPLPFLCTHRPVDVLQQMLEEERTGGSGSGSGGGRIRAFFEAYGAAEAAAMAVMLASARPGSGGVPAVRGGGGGSGLITFVHSKSTPPQHDSHFQLSLNKSIAPTHPHFV